MDKSTIPLDYKNQLRKFASSGFRILAIGCKILTGDWKGIDRSLVECNLSFNGFEIF